MAKILWKPGTMIYPVPAVMVSCGSVPEEYNIITISWTGTLSSDPPMCYISVRPIRHSYQIIKKNREFVINLTTRKLASVTDWCGVKSGREFDKFKETGLTPVKASKVKAPLIEESPLNIECVVKNIQPLGSHDMFVSEVVAVHADAAYLSKKDNVFRLSQAELIAYSHGRYFELGRQVGTFGFSVKRRKKK